MAASTANNWFTVDRVDEDTCIISEYRHWKQTHCYLLMGKERALLIDTGLGICDISIPVRELTDLTVAAVATHVHWDHIGGHGHFPEVFAHGAEADWLRGEFPLDVEAVREMLTQDAELPADYDPETYEIYRGEPTRLLRHGEVIDLGGRSVHVLHMPGRSPGHLCFWEPERGYLFLGDLAFKGTIHADYPTTNPPAYLRSLEKLAVLPAQRIFPGHNSLDVGPDFLTGIRDAFRELQAEGVLCHGSGTYDFGDWSIQL